MSNSTAARMVMERTLDLAELARIQRGDRVEVGPIFDTTDELFQRTLDFLPVEETDERRSRRDRPGEREDRFLPHNEDLRKIYLFAEALGGYEALRDLINAYSPRHQISRKYGEKVQRASLTDAEVRLLEEYHAEITEALRNASAYLQNNVLGDFTAAEIHELHELLILASERAKEIKRILGNHLIHETEEAVQRLHGYLEKIRTVERTVDGIFLVDSEVMFIPTNDLIRCVTTIFKGVGNPYLAENIDGVLLLAARNLLIEVVSFYSYYGKNQIYNLFQKSGAAVSIRAITDRIRREIRSLFHACTAGNKLVLKRIMRDAEREFELSVEAIQAAAEHSAVEAVKVFIPAEEQDQAPVKKKGWFRRLLRWFTR